MSFSRDTFRFFSFHISFLWKFFCRFLRTPLTPVTMCLLVTYKSVSPEQITLLSRTSDRIRGGQCTIKLCDALWKNFHEFQDGNSRTWSPAVGSSKHGACMTATGCTPWGLLCYEIQTKEPNASWALPLGCPTDTCPIQGVQSSSLCLCHVKTPPSPLSREAPNGITSP